MSEIRLGDIIDDHCSRCRMITNHSVVSLLNGEPAKVLCRTCYSEHKYRRGKSRKPKPKSKKSELFEEILGKIRPQS